MFAIRRSDGKFLEARLSPLPAFVDVVASDCSFPSIASARNHLCYFEGNNNWLSTLHVSPEQKDALLTIGDARIVMIEVSIRICSDDEFSKQLLLEGV